MSATLDLTISTPMEVLVADHPVQNFRAEDASGSFGILPGHTEYLTALPASVLRWHDLDRQAHYCAIRSGLLTVTGGTHVAVACRKAVLSDDLDALQETVRDLRGEARDADRRARVEHLRLHAQAVRQMMRFLRPGQPGGIGHPPAMADLIGGEDV